MGTLLNDYTQSVQTYYKEIGRFSLLDRETERKLIQEAQDGNISSRNRILESNLRFVFDIAKGFKGCGLELGELICEGNIGLSKAIEKFDLSNDVKFITYAIFWIRSQILEAIQKNKQKTDNESLNSLDVRLNDKGLYDDSDDTVLLSESIYSNNEDIDLEEQYEENKEYVSKLMKKLSHREKFVVEQYFGIGCKSSHTLNEIGKKLKLSSERIRKIKFDAMKKMRSEAMITSIS